MDASDFAVSRAGSSTVAELTAIGIPALYLPYAVGNGEQSYNLREVTAVGGGLEMQDTKFDREYISAELVPLLSSASKVSQMAAAAKSVGILNGTERLYQLVSGVLSK
jgi:UDP-N-acetylglucosamine--N-acetylmuramyl-(pentapeptide) pyrophosphoryl-undecaprenol N-acetylglucosamine transferase